MGPLLAPLALARLKRMPISRSRQRGMFPIAFPKTALLKCAFPAIPCVAMHEKHPHSPLNVSRIPLLRRSICSSLMGVIALTPDGSQPGLSLWSCRSSAVDTSQFWTHFFNMYSPELSGAAIVPGIALHCCMPGNNTAYADLGLSECWLNLFWESDSRRLIADSSDPWTPGSCWWSRPLKSADCRLLRLLSQAAWEEWLA